MMIVNMKYDYLSVLFIIWRTVLCYNIMVCNVGFHFFFFQIIKMMIVVVIIYAICWLPLHVITIAGDVNITFYNLPGMNIMWTIAHWLAMSNCMYNPFIYCWMNAKYRNGFRKVFRCFSCGLIKSREDLELQRMRRNQANPSSVGSHFSHLYHRTSTICETDYSTMDRKPFHELCA